MVWPRDAVSELKKRPRSKRTPNKWDHPFSGFGHRRPDGKRPDKAEIVFFSLFNEPINSTRRLGRVAKSRE
jgi:hypothetical protein